MLITLKKNGVNDPTFITDKEYYSLI
jgi:hypothetical protein